MVIRRYGPKDEHSLLQLLREEGPEWEDYYGTATRDQFKRAFQSSIVYLCFQENVLCGYARCRDDDGFGVYMYDLLVAKPYRGNNIGRKLLDHVCIEFPNAPVYVMSDADGYYEKLGYERAGSIFAVKPQ